MKPGDRVTILNRSYPKGQVFVEGRATVVKPTKRKDYAAVQFSVDGAEFVRLVDPNAQGLTDAELEVYVDGLNRIIVWASEARKSPHNTKN